MVKAKITPKSQFIVKIKRDSWIIRFYTQSKFEKLWQNCVGITHYNHKRKDDLTISFCGPSVSRDTIAHELMHAYLSYHDFSKTSYGAIEEKICEIIGKKHQTLDRLTDRIYAKLSSCGKRKRR